MTGPRRLRGRLEDDRHGGHERPGPQPIGTHTELEELSVGRVTGRGRTRPGLQASFAVGGLVVLLALGFGAFGGRQDQSAGASPARSAPTAPVLAAGQTPAVTPAAPCAAPPASPPDVLLEVGDTVAPAAVEVRERPVGVSAPPVAPVSQQPGGPRRTRVSPASPVHLRIAGAACAHAWTITIGGTHLDALGNGGLNPAYAAQNRFELSLARYQDSVTELTADLVFQTMSIRATWPLIVEPFPKPAAFLESPRQRWRVTQDVGTFVDDPAPAPDVEAQEWLTFSIVGWQLESASVWCGHMEGLEFSIDPEAGCTGEELPVENELGTGLVRLRAPAAHGRWTLAISACVIPNSLPALESTCATWYASVEVAA